MFLTWFAGGTCGTNEGAPSKKRRAHTARGIGDITIWAEQDPHTTRPHCRQWCFLVFNQLPKLFPHASNEHFCASWSGCHRRRGTWRAPKHGEAQALIAAFGEKKALGGPSSTGTGDV